LIKREESAMGYMATRGAKRKAGGELTQGENSKRPSSWPTCPKYQRQYPGVYWADMTCNICGRKGHPDYKCHDREREGEKVVSIFLESVRFRSLELV
jgi:hypothetical protein